MPDHLAESVEVGSIVRVPLSGRRVRGWVVEVSPDHDGPLKEIAGVSGSHSVFDHALLRSLSWASQHYVAPMAVLLSKATPPNLPKQRHETPAQHFSEPTRPHPLLSIARSRAAGSRLPTQALVGQWQALDWIDSLLPVVSGRQSAMVVAASAAEVSKIASKARPEFGEALVEVSAEGDAAITRAWEKSQIKGMLVIGTPRVATWKIPGLSVAVILEEGRRAMKERQTPTLHVRDFLRRRSLMEAFTMVFFGPTPSVEILSTGAQVTMTGNRAWPLVEVVDRSTEPPGGTLLSERVVAALRAVTDGGERSFVFTHRKTVERLVREINARLGAPAAGLPSDESPITVGTERDLAALAPVGLTVAANADGMLLGSGYRVTEETLRQLARLANSLAPGSGHRMMVQTLDPGSELIQTLRRGDPIPYLERVLVERARASAPPSTEMMAIEIRDKIPDRADVELKQLSGTDVLGPLELENGKRWLLQGDLGRARPELRRMVSRWRESGSTVRVDADPIDL